MNIKLSSSSISENQQQNSNPEKYNDDIDSSYNSIFLKIKDKDLVNKSLSDVENIFEKIQKFSSMPLQWILKLNL